MPKNQDILFETVNQLRQESLGRVELAIISIGDLIVADKGKIFGIGSFFRDNKFKFGSDIDLLIVFPDGYFHGAEEVFNWHDNIMSVLEDKIKQHSIDVWIFNPFISTDKKIWEEEIKRGKLLLLFSEEKVNFPWENE